MKFWDSSALAPLLTEEAESASCRALLRADTKAIVWLFTRTELTSVLCRCARQGLLTGAALDKSLHRLDVTATYWQEIDAVALVRKRAEILLRRAPLTAADALQLGAALVAVDGRPKRQGFVALDRALLAAAEREGFEAIRPGA